MTIAVINYGMGNLKSVRRAFELLGATVSIANSPSELSAAERMVLPGVGSFGDAMTNLRRMGWADAIPAQVAAGKPLLGICLGMQLLADTGREGGVTSGLALIPGEIVRLDEIGCKLRIPHVGWNSISIAGGTSGSFASSDLDKTDFYFVHSYAFVAKNNADVLAHTSYGVDFAAVVAAGNVFGTQFHPEKSSKAGFRMLENFLNVSTC